MRFMYGRYGVDKLYYALFGLLLALMILNLFLRSIIVQVIMWLVIILMLFRMMSRNANKRRRENEKFLKIWNPIKGWFVRAFTRIKDFRKKVYRKCPNCKASIRLPYMRGDHTVECPRCHKNFNVKVRL